MTLVVNLFGGPGCGKSTTSALLFGKLKNLGVNCELVTEYAKDLVWEESTKTLQDSLYVFANQRHRLLNVKNKVDIVITDSPILLCLFYKDEQLEPYFSNIVLKSHYQFNNLNIVLNRIKPFQQIGRVHTEEQSKNIDLELRKLLSFHEIQYREIDGNEKASDIICELILGGR